MHDDEKSMQRKASMKLKSYVGYWIVSMMLLILGLDILLTEITSHHNPVVDHKDGTYLEFVSGILCGNSGINIHDETLSYNAFLIYWLVIPYLLLTIGLWLGFVGYRRRRANKALMFDVQRAISTSNSKSDQKTVWPPPI